MIFSSKIHIKGSFTIKGMLFPKMRELGGMGKHGVSFPATVCEQTTSSRRCTVDPAPYRHRH